MVEQYFRLVANATYLSYAKKHKLELKTKTGKPKPMTTLAKAVYANETKHLKEGKKVHITINFFFYIIENEIIRFIFRDWFYWFSC
jgi:hypothetical protein